MVEVTLGITYKQYRYRKAIKKMLGIEYRILDSYNNNVLNCAIKLKGEEKYSEALIALSYVNDVIDRPDIMNSSDTLNTIGDCLYHTNQYDSALHYYKLYYLAIVNENRTSYKLLDPRVTDYIHIKILLTAGADVNIQEYIFGSTALIYAISDNNHKLAQLLLEYGADIHLKNNSGEYAFDVAMKKIDVDILRVLLNAGLDVNTRDNKNGSTAIMFAAQQGNSAAVKLLIGHRADITLKSRHRNYSVFEFAMQYMNFDVVTALLDYGLDINTQHIKNNATFLMEAALIGHIDIVKMLLNRGADTTLRSTIGYTAIDYTSCKHTFELLFNHKKQY